MENNTNNEGYFKMIPPHDNDAEKAVLSSIIMDREAAEKAFELLKGEDFYRPDHRIIFESAYELYSENKPIDIITLSNKLTEKNSLETVGGVGYLAEIAASVGNSVHVLDYSEIITNKSTLRSLINTSNSIIKMSYEGSSDIGLIMDTAEKGIFDIMQSRISSDFYHIKDVAVNAFEKISEVYSSKGKVTGVPTGFSTFDTKTAGLQKSDLILIAARPSMGKTAFALNIAQYAAVKAGIPTAIFSLEMSREQLVNRMLCSEASVDAQKLRTGDLDERDWPKLVEAMGILSRSDIYIDDTPGITPMEIKAKCRKLKVEKGLGLVIIDYLQLMSANRNSASRQQEISDISRALKAIAREIDAPVIALSQLSRACEQRSDHRPMLSDLRESGAIEQDADVVAFLYRDAYYNKDTEKQNGAELIIAKQRNGPTGTIELTWLGQYTKFKEAEIST